MLGIVNQTSQRRAPANSPRYAYMLPTAPGHSATVLVAFATSRGTPSQTMAGNVTSVPPPATELTALPVAAARKMRMNVGMDKGAVSGTYLATRLTQTDGSRQLSRRIVRIPASRSPQGNDMP